ncbi:XdhC family protein [Pokkaliibacter plantistimulans]|uniref:XdhC family protein n=1 Tax=Pokkaliibacter plantistimulans TaxID=1635171 RepID=UPI002D77AEF6|nr:XdhC family protein [Pokkaliibacter plantistimulans]
MHDRAWQQEYGHVIINQFDNQEDVWPRLLRWARRGYRTALVSLIHIEGSSPRALGAQMAVTDSGEFVGYLSGGCVEKSVALEAVECLQQRHNRSSRYGKDSPYVDIELPCGSGLDIYYDQNLSLALIEQVMQLKQQRVPFWHVTDLLSGQSRIVEMQPGQPASTQRRGDEFWRAHLPAPQMIVIGAGPAVAAIGHIAAAMELETQSYTNNQTTLREVASVGISANHHFATAARLDLSEIDPWSAVVLCFHDHDIEADILHRLLSTPAFYIGAMGSPRAHQLRLQYLQEQGVAEAQITRVKGPIGLIRGAKSRLPLALGIVAEVVAEARTLGLIV